MAQSNLGKINLGKFNLGGGAESFNTTYISIGAASLSLAGLAPTVELGPLAVPIGVGSLSLTGKDLAVLNGLQPDPASLTLAGLAPVVIQATVVELPVGALTFSGLAVTVSSQVAPITCTDVTVHDNDKTLEWDDEPVERLGT